MNKLVKILQAFWSDLKSEYIKLYEKREYYFFIWKIWFKHPLAWFFFFFFLLLNSILFCVFVPLYFGMLLIWFYRAYKLVNKKTGEMKPQKLQYNPLNVFTNYFWTETIWKSYILSYFFVYNCLKKKYNKSETFSSKIFLLIICNFVIKQFTGYSKKLLCDSFNSSLKFRKWENWTHFYNSWFFDLMPIVANVYVQIEQCRIYFENNEIKFNPIKDPFTTVKKLNHDIDTLIITETETFKKINNSLHMFRFLTSIKNVKITGINNYHIAFVGDYFTNRKLLVSTLTTNDKFKSNCLWYFINNNTNIISYITKPLLVNLHQLKEVKWPITETFSTRNLINTEEHLNLFLISLLLNDHYYLNINSEDILYKEELKSDVDKLQLFYRNKFTDISNYTKNLYLLSYIKLYNNAVYNNLFLQGNTAQSYDLLFIYP